MTFIKSISFDENEILSNILKLHCGGRDIELDPTYSTGNFYKKGLKQPLYKFDIMPQQPDVIGADAANMPIKDGSINIAIFDPPFLATTGKSLKINNKSNKINKRFSVFKSEKELFEFYYKSLKEFYRILKDDGILIFKNQDKVSGGKQYFSHCMIYNWALEIGFEVKDLFILLAKHRIMAQWQIRNQKNARKFHCYFWILKKGKRK